MIEENSNPERSNIVLLRSGKPLELSTRKMEVGKKCFIKCKIVHVDEHNRLLECKECGRAIDPFDYLWQWAVEGDRRMADLKHVTDEIRVKNNELYDLKRQISNAKSQLRRASLIH